MDWEQDAYEKNERYIEISHFDQLPSDFKEGSRLNLGGLGQVICHNIVRLTFAVDNSFPSQLITDFTTISCLCRHREPCCTRPPRRPVVVFVSARTCCSSRLVSHVICLGLGP